MVVPLRFARLCFTVVAGVNLVEPWVALTVALLIRDTRHETRNTEVPSTYNPELFYSTSGMYHTLDESNYKAGQGCRYYRQVLYKYLSAFASNSDK